MTATIPASKVDLLARINHEVGRALALAEALPLKILKSSESFELLGLLLRRLREAEVIEKASEAELRWYAEKCAAAHAALAAECLLAQKTSSRPN